jgi:hypothetical protein
MASNSEVKTQEAEAQRVQRPSQSDSKRDGEIAGTEGIEMGVVSDSKGGLINGTTSGIPAEDLPRRPHMSGWRLYVLTFGLCVSLLLSTLETTIVSTSLVSITNALSGFENRDWVVTSYLLTYTGTVPFDFQVRGWREIMMYRRVPGHLCEIQ